MFCGPGASSRSASRRACSAVTNDWVVPDESHHGHVRQYGRDFENRLADAGFRVEVDRLLLERTLAEHLAAGTFPLRIYVCRKD